MLLNSGSIYSVSFQVYRQQ